MNQFTKDELEDLIEWGNTYCVDMPTIAKMHHSNLLGKIESLIDNYCEHKRTGEVRDVDYVKICTECKELTGWL